VVLALLLAAPSQVHDFDLARTRRTKTTMIQELLRLSSQDVDTPNPLATLRPQFAATMSFIARLLDFHQAPLRTKSAAILWPATPEVTLPSYHTQEFRLWPQYEDDWFLVESSKQRLPSIEKLHECQSAHTGTTIHIVMLDSLRPLQHVNSQEHYMSTFGNAGTA
jgi:hypothetical protein